MNKMLNNTKTIFKSIVGSQAYGTATKNSDIDYKGIYIQDINDILSFNYIEQYQENKDETYFEVKRFLELLKTGNPNILELLYMPENCIITKEKEFDLILKHKERFLTKKCKNTFAGYALTQIKKARGLDKKINWEKQRTKRKTPLDFTYVHENGKTKLINDWLTEKELYQEKCGLTKLNHFKDCYALYYDNGLDLKFKGLIKENSNELRLSSIPKYLKPLTIIFYNKDGYSMHCKDYNQYQTWIKERNIQRFVDNKSHDQKYDGKNLLHCRRLLDMAIEIAKEGKITVKRPNVEYLMKIRRGEVDLESIISKAEEDVQKLDDLYLNSGLPDDVDEKFVNNLLLEIRYY